MSCEFNKMIVIYANYKQKMCYNAGFYKPSCLIKT